MSTLNFISQFLISVKLISLICDSFVLSDAYKFDVCALLSLELKNSQKMMRKSQKIRKR